MLLEGRAWQARAAAVLQQPSVVAAAAAAIEADPCASVCSLWNADIAAAATMEMRELEALIGERLTPGFFGDQGLMRPCISLLRLEGFFFVMRPRLGAESACA